MRNILFIHIGPQFLEIHNYFNKNKIANSYFLTSTNYAERIKADSNNIFSFTPPLMPNSEHHNLDYYYSGWVETGAKISLKLLDEVRKIISEYAVEIIVAHQTFGSPQFLFEEFDVPIITYMEFSCFKVFGWDKNYPPTFPQILNDKAFEMLSMYELVKSDAIITPSKYVKYSLPKEFHPKINVQAEGFQNKIVQGKPKNIIRKKKGTIYLGYSARVLCSSKGFEQFIKISKALIKIESNIHFVILGSEFGKTYGYESVYLNQNDFQGSFKEYICQKEQINPEYYTFYDFLPYEEYSNIIQEIDAILYPLQFGSLNWGFLDLLFHSKIIFASNRCYIPEIIEDGVNGFVIDYDDIDAWVGKIVEVVKNLNKYKSIAINAFETSKQFDVSKSAANYLEIIEKVIAEKENKKEVKMRKFLNVGGFNKNIPVPEYYQGYEHIMLDIDKKNCPDILLDARKIKGYFDKKNKFDAIYCSHNLEHFFLDDVKKVLDGFYDALKEDGFVEIKVPDIKAVVEKVYLENLEIDDVLYQSGVGPIKVYDVLYGYQKYIKDSKTDFFQHKIGFTQKFLRKLLNKCGFPIVIERRNSLELAFFALKKRPNQYVKGLLAI